ncbi:MAG: F0F1 ATP synthase subunit B [Phycisphaerales bacterium JB039]
MRSFLATFLVLLAALALAPSAAGQDAHGDDPQAHSGEPAAAGQDTHAGEDAHGEGEHATGGGVIPDPNAGIPMSIAAIVIFLLVFAILSKTAWPKILGGLADREAKLREGIEAAKRLKAEADEIRGEYESKLAEARAEAQNMLAETKHQQQQFAAELRTKAEHELTAMKDRARRDIEAAKRAAVGEVYAEAADLATMVAGKILKREVSAADQQRLVDESLAQLQARSN